MTEETKTEWPELELPEVPTMPWQNTYNSYRGRREFIGLNAEDVETLSAELDAWKAAHAEYAEKHKAMVAEKIEAVTALGFRAEARVPVKSRSQYQKYEKRTLADALRKFLPEAYSAPTDARAISSLRDEIKRARKHLEEQEKERKAAERKKEAQDYETEAVNWLMAKGKVYGKDFSAHDAVMLADEIAGDEETARTVAELKLSGGYIDFSGQNCMGPCEGWDGHSHRCQCGNRRMCWATHMGHSFKSPAVYGEAY